MKKKDRSLIITPSEYGSLRVRVTKGCPWNRCVFCGCYKDKTYEERSLGDIQEDIKSSEGTKAPGDKPYTRAFLQDANAGGVSTSKLIRINEQIREVHPYIERVSSYGRTDSILEKSEEELRELNAKVNSRAKSKPAKKAVKKKK